VRRRRIKHRPAIELETATLRLPEPLVRAVDDYARHLGRSTDRTYVITQALEPDEDFQNLRGNGSAPADLTARTGE